MAADDTWKTTQTIAGQLDRLNDYAGHDWRRMKTTIIALTDARLANETEESVWARPNTCNRKTYHTKWKKDALFADVLAAVTKAAHAHQDQRAARALATASERLALAAPAGVNRLIGLLGSEDEAIILRAAVAILDRAGLETASKQSAAVGTLDDWRQQAEKRRREAEETLSDFDKDDADTDADADEEEDQEDRSG